MAATPVKIVCDSCADLPPALLGQHGITRIPLTVSFGDELLRDGVDVTPAEFYDRLRTARTMPTTSQIPPQQYANAFAPLTAEGNEVVYIGLSSGVSGSVQNAFAAAADFGGKVHVVDSLGASVGLGLMVLRAADLAAAGKSGAEIAADITEYRTRICHVFTLDTLEYARRSGRISALSAIAAGVLDIKPILNMDMAGKLVPIDRVRGRKRALSRLFDEMERLGADPRGKRVGLCHAHVPDEAEEMAERFRTKYGAQEVVIGEIGATIGAHVGPGCISIFFEGPAGRGE